MPYDGHQQLRGCWGGNPASVPEGYAQRAVNRFFREDEHRTRSAIQNIPLEFESEEQRIWFEAANGQGATFYNTYPSYVTPRLVASLGGRIFTIELQGQRGVVKQLFDGNSRQFMHAWFGQGFEWLAVQDGINPPVLWNGSAAARRSDITKNEMPVGSVMAFIHGRFVVASADGLNTIRISEIAYANTNLNRDDILVFPPELPTYDIAANLGSINGLYPMPFLDTGTAQNELVAMCTQGFTSFNFSGDEASLLGQIQKISLVGSGLQSSHGFAGLNGDVFFRSVDGISTYRNARIEYDQSWRLSPVSREVNYWIKPDRKDLLEFIPMVNWQNMVFTGCSPQIEAPNNPGFGYHRYCRGFVVFDADNMSTAGRDGNPVWHGMWSGIRPWAFAQGLIGTASRCFAFSYDRDGRNRLYEVTLSQTDDTFNRQNRKIVSSYTTKQFGITENLSAFAPKYFDGGVLEFSGVNGASTFAVDYRPDGSPCWVPILSGTPGCACPDLQREDCGPYTAAPQWGRAYFPQVKPTVCLPGSKQPAAVFHHCQMRITMTGSFVVDRMNIDMRPAPDGQRVSCDLTSCKPIDCCPSADDYAYHIAPAGVNTEVPTIPDVTPVFTASRSYRAVCPSLPSLFVIGYGSASSTISQADADAKAQAAAQTNAEAQLDCPSCTPALIYEFPMVNGDTEDLSAYFAADYSTSANNPWRLTSDDLIVTGAVSDAGVLEVVTEYTDNADFSFNTGTFVLTYTGVDPTTVRLEIGCNIGGTQTWP